MRFEANHLLQRLVEISLEADRAVVDEHMRGGLPPGDGGDEIVKTVLTQPSAHACRMTRREDDDVEAVSAERFEKAARTGPRRIPVIRILPTGVGVEYAIEIDAHQRTRRVVEVDPRHSRIMSVCPPNIDLRRNAGSAI
jgi:hypothetical protein